MQLLTKDLNELYSSTPALYEQDNDPAGFQWINGGDTDRNVLTFIRRDAAGNPLVCAFNFSGGPHTDFRLGVPTAGEWQEVLNTDADTYGGSGVLNEGTLTATDVGHRRPAGHPHRHAASPGCRVLQTGELTPGPEQADARRRARNPRDSGLFWCPAGGRFGVPLSPGKVVVEFISALLPGVDRPPRPRCLTARRSRDAELTRVKRPGKLEKLLRSDPRLRLWWCRVCLLFENSIVCQVC